MALAAALARLLLRGVEPGSYPRGGKVHLRVWLASRVQDELAAAGPGGAPWFPFYARLLGAEIGKGADLHTLPPVTGMLKVGKDAAVEPEVDLGGYWIDGDVFHVGEVRIGARARDRRPQHARAGGRVRQGRRGGPGLAGRRVGPGRRVLVGLARRAGRRPDPGPVVGPAAARAPPLGRRLRPDVAARRRRCPGLAIARRGRGARAPAVRRAAVARRGAAHGAALAAARRPGRVRRAGAAGPAARPAPRPRHDRRASTRAVRRRRADLGARSGSSTRPGPGCSRSTPAP